MSRRLRICERRSRAAVFALALAGVMAGNAPGLYAQTTDAGGTGTTGGGEETAGGADTADKANGVSDAADASSPESKPDSRATEPAPPPPPPSTLRIATWSGAYSEAQTKAVFEPFTAATGIGIEPVMHSGGGALARTGAANGPKWDVAIVPAAAARRACEQGTIRKFNSQSVVSGDGSAVRASEFVPGAFGACGVASTVWSSVIAFDRRRFGNDAPASIADFFDLARYPGRRALPKQPKYLFEMALMADGVEPGDVYRTLESAEGVARAFEKLEVIRKSIVWWTNAREPAELLRDGKVAMAIGFNGRFFIESAAGDAPFELLWDGQIYDLDVWVVPQATQHAPTAERFIGFASATERMVAQARWLPYGPARFAAAEQVGRHASLPVTLEAFLPTARANFSRALQLDERWWAANSERLLPQFRAWLEGKTGAGVNGDGESDEDGESATEAASESAD